MTLFAQIEGGIPVAYPLDRSALAAMFPNFCWGEDIMPGDLLPDGVVELLETVKPDPQPGKAIIEAPPQLISGNWTQVWADRDLDTFELNAREAVLHAKIDREAGEFRRRFITVAPGQEQTYAEKEKEARAYMVDPEADYLFLTAEATARGVTVADVAALVIDTADAWRPLGAAIEGARMGAKAAVTAGRTASDWAAMDAAAAVDWEALLAP